MSANGESRHGYALDAADQPVAVERTEHRPVVEFDERVVEVLLARRRLEAVELGRIALVQSSYRGRIRFADQVGPGVGGEVEEVVGVVELDPGIRQRREGCPPRRSASTPPAAGAPPPPRSPSPWSVRVRAARSRRAVTRRWPGRSPQPWLRHGTPRLRSPRKRPSNPRSSQRSRPSAHHTEAHARDARCLGLSPWQPFFSCGMGAPPRMPRACWPAGCPGFGSTTSGARRPSARLSDFQRCRWSHWSPAPWSAAGRPRASSWPASPSR